MQYPIPTLVFHQCTYPPVCPRPKLFLQCTELLVCEYPKLCNIHTAYTSMLKPNNFTN